MQLRKPMGPAPRLTPAYKFYMAHVDHETKVNDAFEVEWSVADLPKSHALDFRCKLAKRLFNEEPLEIQMTMEQGAKAAHETALAAHASGIKAEPTDVPEEQDL